MKKITLILLLLMSPLTWSDEYRILIKTSEPFFNEGGQNSNFGGGPGQSTLDQGTGQAGLFGEVSSSELFSGTELANEIGLNHGETLFNNAAWFKFAYEGKTLFIPKKNLLYRLSWDQINDVNAVYGGENAPIVSKNGHQYKVRLMDGFKGMDVVPYSNSSQRKDPEEAKEGEWVKLIYKIHQTTPPNQDGPNWINYNDSQVNINDGQRSWLQETPSHDQSERISSGYYSLKDFRPIRSDRTAGYDGWRPVLELQ